MKNQNKLSYFEWQKRQRTRDAVAVKWRINNRKNEKNKKDGDEANQSVKNKGKDDKK